MTRRRTLAATARSSSVWCAWAVSRSRETPSGVDGGRKQPILRPHSAAAATAASASRGRPGNPGRVGQQGGVAADSVGQLGSGLDYFQRGQRGTGGGRRQPGV